ncbi:ustYa family protein [Pleurotus pulmonarius]
MIHLAPGNEAISYKYQRFFVGSKHDRSPFQSPPSPELDERWEDLYHFGISRIPKAQAVKLPNATAAIPGDESHYIAELDVFHQLHCLNIVRKTIYSEHYTDMHISLANNEEHVSHCIESLRQSVMCASDISVIVWQWDQEARKSRVRLDAVHQCRDFDRIREWGLKRQLKEDFNEDIHVESDLKPPPLLY